MTLRCLLVLGICSEVSAPSIRGPFTWQDAYAPETPGESGAAGKVRDLPFPRPLETWSAQDYEPIALFEGVRAA